MEEEQWPGPPQSLQGLWTAATEHSSSSSHDRLLGWGTEDKGGLTQQCFLKLWSTIRRLRRSFTSRPLAWKR